MVSPLALVGLALLVGAYTLLCMYMRANEKKDDKHCDCDICEPTPEDVSQKQPEQSCETCAWKHPDTCFFCPVQEEKQAQKDMENFKKE